MAGLAVGATFSSTDDAIAYVSTYNDTNFTNFVRTSNCKKALVYCCRHGIQRSSKFKGARPNQHYNFVDCKATIRMYKSKDGSLKVTRSNLEHSNHILVNESVHGFNSDNLDEIEIDLVRTLKEANTKTSQIKRILCTRTNKRISTQRMKNLIAKFVATVTANNK